jgi:hypothetical protein
VYWLRHYGTSRKAAGSRPDKVNDFFSIYLILPVYTPSKRNEYLKEKNNISGE